MYILSCCLWVDQHPQLCFVISRPSSFPLFPEREPLGRGWWASKSTAYHPSSHPCTQRPINDLDILPCPAQSSPDLSRQLFSDKRTKTMRSSSALLCRFSTTSPSATKKNLGSRLQRAGKEDGAGLLGPQAKQNCWIDRDERKRRGRHTYGGHAQWAEPAVWCNNWIEKNIALPHFQSTFIVSQLTNRNPGQGGSSSTSGQKEQVRIRERDLPALRFLFL